MTLILDIALGLGLLALAWQVIVAQDDQRAIMAFIAFGLLLGLCWARLASIDVALTEAAIGGGVTGLILMRAEAHLRKGTGETAPPPTPRKTVAAMACAALSLGLAAAVLSLPHPGPSLAREAGASLDGLGLGNPVTAVLLAYRALDTLLEKVVLVLALVGVWSLAPDGLWGGAPQLRPAQPPEPLIFLAQALPPFGVVVAVYQFWVGADAPGGTFQAGTILAAMWLLVMLAGLRPEPEIRARALRVVLAGGPLLFVTIGLLGFAVAEGFLSYPKALAKPLIVAIEAVLTLSIAATLGLLVAGPSARSGMP